MKSNSFTQIGMKPQIFSLMNQNLICTKRNDNLNYHNLVSSSRSASCPISNFKCGSPTDSDKQFCFNATQCPSNEITIRGVTNATVNQTRFAENWTIQYSKNNSVNSPIADLYIGISRPCGYRGQKYVNRTGLSKSYYDVDDKFCEYNNSGSVEHELYYPLNFSQTELDVYSSN